MIRQIDKKKLSSHKTIELWSHDIDAGQEEKKYISCFVLTIFIRNDYFSINYIFVLSLGSLFSSPINPAFLAMP